MTNKKNTKTTVSDTMSDKPHSAKPSTAKPPNRRDMLRGMAVFAAAAAPTAAVAAPAEQPPPSDPNTVEFTETDHVRQYYALARR